MPIKDKIFPTCKKCKCPYPFMQRVNDIQVGNVYYRQIHCVKHGNYKYKIEINDYHPLLKNEVFKFFK